jgi:hypothetical protein
MWTGTHEKYSPQFISEGVPTAIGLAELNEYGFYVPRVVADQGLRDSFRHKATSKAQYFCVSLLVSLFLTYFEVFRGAAERMMNESKSSLITILPTSMVETDGFKLFAACTPKMRPLSSTRTSLSFCVPVNSYYKSSL